MGFLFYHSGNPTQKKASGNFAKLCYTPWKFLRSKTKRPLEIPHNLFLITQPWKFQSFFLINPWKPTCYSSIYLPLEIPYTHAPFLASFLENPNLFHIKKLKQTSNEIILTSYKLDKTTKMKEVINGKRSLETAHQCLANYKAKTTKFILLLFNSHASLIHFGANA